MQVKEHFSEVFRIAGGVHITLNPDEKYLSFFDAICIGEGEYPTLELVQRMVLNEPLTGIQNLWLKTPDGIEKNLTRPFIQDLDKIPIPNRDIWQEWILESNTRFITGAGYGFGGMNIGNLGINSSANSFGINYSSNGGFGTSIGGLQYNKETGWTANPSFGVSYSLTSGLYGTANVEDIVAANNNVGNPLPYNNETAESFMKKNNLNSTGYDNLHADGSLASGNYQDSKTGKIYFYNDKGKKVYTDGATLYNGKKYFFWGKQKIDVYLYAGAFSSPEKLYLTIGHELIHVGLYNLGLYDVKRHEATAYSWSYDQAQLWGLSLAAMQYLSLKSSYIDLGYSPYSYQKPTRTSRPIWP